MYLRRVMKVTSGDIFSIQTADQFEETALAIFRHQAKACTPYASFISNLGVKVADIKRYSQIPHLPVEFFKSHAVISGNKKPRVTFSSSGTSGMPQSQHHVTDIAVYQKSFRLAFKQFYGDVSSMGVLALLPSYLEREGSSLIYMVDDLIKKSNIPESGYFLYNYMDLYQALKNLQQQQIPTLLIGVTYALFDFAESHSMDFPELKVMETGGMKGKRSEMIREELHEILCNGFGVPVIHSEYGMTEMLSQAYSKGGGIFHCPNWLCISVRDVNDTLTILPAGKTGGINVTDLANINSCSFIATQDLGKVNTDGTFEVLGRFDNSDIRGCNLLVQ